MYTKFTNMRLDSNKVIQGSGFWTNLEILKQKGVKRVSYYIIDMSGKGRNGASGPIDIDDLTDNSLLIKASMAV